MTGVARNKNGEAMVARSTSRQNHAKGNIDMRWPPVLRGLLGAKSQATDSGQGRPSKDAVPVGQFLEDKTVAVSCHSLFEDCHFKTCRFLWAGRAAGWREKIFLNCTFEDCDFGMPVAEFLAYTVGGVINTGESQSLTRQQAIDEAVRRLQRERPFLMELSLRPSHQKAREQVAEWVRAEYQKIMAEDAIAVAEPAAVSDEVSIPSEVAAALPEAA